MQKLTPNRHKVVVEAMAFMHQYAKHRVAPGEAHYNIARAYHQLGILHLAMESYNRVLKQRDAPHSLKRNAALNLSLIYRKSGANGLAVQLLHDYVTI